MKTMGVLLLCLASLGLVSAAVEPVWEPAPFMETTMVDATHVAGFTVRGRTFLATGNLRIPEFDYCGECATREDFSDHYYEYDPETGFTDLGAFPPGRRGYAIGSIMYPGDPEREMYYFGMGQTRYQMANGTYIETPRWGFNDDGTYTLANRSTYPRINDLWSFDGTEWKQLASMPTIGRTHPALVAVDGKVYVGAGYGELCPQPEPCANITGIGDPRGQSGNLDDFWEYDVATDTWTQIDNYPTRAHHPFQFALNGTAYVMAGHNGAFLFNSVYSIESGSFYPVYSIPSDPRVAGAMINIGDYGCVIAGETDYGSPLLGHSNGPQPDAPIQEHRSFPTTDFWCYSPETERWLFMPPVPNERSRW